MKTKTPALSILVVDDCEFFREGIINYLKLIKLYSLIVEAGNSDEALELIEDGNFDLVLMGMQIGPISGFGITALIKQKPQNIKVIGISGCMDEFYVLEMFKKGADGYLLKTVKKDELLFAIKKVMKGETYYPDYLIKNFITEKDGKINHAISEKPYIQIRIREIIYLTCKNKTAKEIAVILFVSLQTINRDRLLICKMIGSNGTTAIVNYGIEIGILHDEALNKKFKKYFISKRKVA